VMERLEQGRNRVVFRTISGPLPVNRAERGYVMDFPARPSVSQPAPKGMAEALGIVPLEVLSNAFNYMADWRVPSQCEPSTRILERLHVSTVPA
jgi:hypothetical protein